MEFRVLGPLEVRDDDGRLVPLGGPKRRALLALLVLTANEVISTDRLAAELWADNRPANAAGSIHNHVSRLRKGLGSDVLVTHTWGYVLRIHPEQIDAHRFETLARTAEALPAAERATRLAEALSHWRGPPLADLAFEPALATHIARLEELRISALEQRLDAELELGRDSELVPELEQLIAAQPLREHFRWQLILALYRSGRQAEALEVYRETRRMLAEELGLEPSPELRELERAVLRQDPALAPLEPQHRVSEQVVPLHTQRARRRARAALLTMFAVVFLAASGYGLAAIVDRHHADHTAATETTRQDVKMTHTAITKTRQRSQTQLAVVRARPTSRRSAPRSQRPDTATTRTRPRRTQRRVSPPPAHTAPTTRQAATTTTTTTAATTSSPTPRHRRPSPTTTAAAPPRTATTTPTATTPLGPATLGDTRGWWVGGDQSQVSVTQAPGSATFSVAATARSGFNSSLVTRCRLVGDFDVRVAFDLTQWPGADGIWVSLMAADLGGVNVYRSDSFGETWGAYVPPTGSTSTSASGTTGALRLIRQGSEFTAEYDAGAGWATLYQAAGPSAPTAVQLGVFNLANVAPFAGFPAEIRFSSFSETGAISC